jgi:hypothetical protein
VAVICTNVGSLPSIIGQIFSRSVGPLWLIPLTGVTLSIFTIVTQWRMVPRGRWRIYQSLVLAGFFLLVFGGVFVLLAVVDPWGYALFLWYRNAIDTLQSQGCSTASVDATYARLSGNVATLRAVAVASAIVGWVILFPWRVLLHRRYHMPSR